jgi:hypothetical protein
VLVVGETLPPGTFPANPLLHANVEMLPLPAIALAASMVLPPIQIIAGIAFGATVGRGFTVTVLDVVAVHIFASVTVTEYEVVVVGETEIAIVFAELLQE